MSIRDPRDFEDERPIDRGGYHHYKSNLRDTDDDWGGLPKPCDLGSLKHQVVRLSATLLELSAAFNDVSEERDELKIKNDVATDNAHMYCEEIRHWKSELDLLQKRHDGEQKAKARAEKELLRVRADINRLYMEKVAAEKGLSRVAYGGVTEMCLAAGIDLDRLEEDRAKFEKEAKLQKERADRTLLELWERDKRIESLESALERCRKTNARLIEERDRGREL